MAISSSTLRSARRQGRTLSTRFLGYFAIAYLVLIAVMGWGIVTSAESTLVDRLIAQLETDAGLSQQSLPTEPSGYQDWATSVREVSGARATLIDTLGVVLADSHSDPAVMENHAARPEVVAALAGEPGRATRRSASTGYDQQYVALPPKDGLIVRLSISEAEIEGQIAPIRSTVLLTGSLVGLLGILVVWLLASRAARPISQLTQVTATLAGGDRSVRPDRSSISEVDRLALAITQLADDLGARLEESKSATAILEVVLSALPQGTILVSSDDSIGYANPAADLLIGPIAPQLQSLTPFPLQNLVAECRESGASVVRLLDHGSPTIRLSVEAAPLSVHGGSVLLILTDVTEELKTATIRHDFVANASHELKTPLAAILASSEALRIAVERDPSLAAKFAGQVEESARHMNDLVSDLLDLSRLDRQPPRTSAIALDEVVVKVIDEMAAASTERGVVVTVSLQPVVVDGDERDLSVAIRNVYDNALRHCREGDEISVGLTVEGRDAVISVSDGGEGIPARDLDRIFERFYRVDEARSRSAGGTGLGLSIVKHVIESHGGQVSVESELGRGSTFYLRLPRMSGDSVSGSK